MPISTNGNNENGSSDENQSVAHVRVLMDELKADHFLHPHYCGDTACRAFAHIDLRGLARWKGEGELKRGQLVGAAHFFASRWKWSESTVQRFLMDLQERGLIEKTRRWGKKPSIITICNYDLYNGKLPDKRPTNSRTNDHQVKKVELKGIKTSNDNNDNNTRIGEPIRVNLAGGNEQLQEMPDRGDPLISENTFAGVCRRLNYGKEPEDGIGNEIRRLRTSQYDPITGCEVLVGLALFRKKGGLNIDEVSLRKLEDLDERLISLATTRGKIALSGVRNSSELHDRLDERFSDTNRFRPEDAGVAQAE